MGAPTDGPASPDEDGGSKRPPDKGIGDAIKVHQQHTANVLPTGDSREIKKLYVELGELIDEAVHGDADAVPQLSFPEIGPILGAVASDLRGRILDAGCGPNPIFSLMLGRDGTRKMVGFDISHAIVRLAAERAKSEGVAFVGVVGDLEALPFRPNVMDGCICEDTIEHLPDDTQGLREIARVLRPGGRLVLGTPNRIRLDVLWAKAMDTARGKRKDPSEYYAANSHLREYTWGTLERLARPFFSLRRRATVGWGVSSRGRLLSRFIQVPPLRWVGRMLILDLEVRSDSKPT